jgi:hypothetical protein
VLLAAVLLGGGYALGKSRLALPFPGSGNAGAASDSAAAVQGAPPGQDANGGVSQAAAVRVDTVHDTVRVSMPRPVTAAERFARLFHWLVTLGALGGCAWLLAERQRRRQPEGGSGGGPGDAEIRAWVGRELSEMSRHFSGRVGSLEKRVEQLEGEPGGEGARARRASEGAAAAAAAAATRPSVVADDGARQDSGRYDRDRGGWDAGARPGRTADDPGSRRYGGTGDDDGFGGQHMIDLPRQGEADPPPRDVQFLPAELNEEGVFVLLTEEVSRPMAEIRWRPGSPHAEGRILPHFVFGLNSRRLSLAFEMQDTPSGRYETAVPARVAWREGATSGPVIGKGTLRFLGA